MQGSLFWRQVCAIVILPGVGTVLVPAILLSRSGGWHGLAAAPGALQVSLIASGTILGTLGLVLMATSVALFARVGRGTPAPWDPPEKLVVRDVYRHVRNPMISGVMMVLLAEAALFASRPILIWFAGFALVNIVYIPLMEEPGLVPRFGEPYREYRRNVPRWIPRFRPWSQPE